jgi:hypothetical protein
MNIELCWIDLNYLFLNPLWPIVWVVAARALNLWSGVEEGVKVDSATLIA